MLTFDQEMLIEMIDHIENKDVKTKFIRKLKEKGQQNTLPLSNTYKFKDVMSQFEPKTPMTIQDLQFEIKQIKEQIEELNIFTQGIYSRIENIEHRGIVCLATPVRPEKFKFLEKWQNRNFGQKFKIYSLGSQMTKRISPLELFRKIKLMRRILLNSDTVKICTFFEASRFKCRKTTCDVTKVTYNMYSCYTSCMSREMM